MFKCEICYDWCSRTNITKQWWDIARNDWNSLNGRDLPYYVAILAVLGETTKEIFQDKSYSRNHVSIKNDKEGYALVSNKNCEFVPLTELQKIKWNGLRLTIRAFRNAAAHISHIESMNPTCFMEPKNPEDSHQDYYRYAPFAYLPHKGRKQYDSDLKEIHEFVKCAILSDMRSLASNVPSDRIAYELCHVERSQFINLLHSKMIELLEEVKVW